MARIHFNRSTCQISGKYVPVAEMKLHDDDWVYFSHHVLLHTDPRIRLDTLKMGRGWNRVRAGMPLIMMTAQGPGHIAFSADHPGETLAVPLSPGHAIDVVEHRFLVATGNVTYQWENSGVWYTTQDGDEQETHYPLGQTMDRFSAQGGPGPPAAARPGQHVPPRPAAQRAHPDPAGRAGLEGPDGQDAPPLRVPEGRLLVQLGAVGDQDRLADPDGTGPGGDPVGL